MHALLEKTTTNFRRQMCLVFFLQYLDKQSLSYASVSFVHPDDEYSSLQAGTGLWSDHRPKLDEHAVLVVQLDLLHRCVVSARSVIDANSSFCIRPACFRIPLHLPDEPTSPDQVCRRYSVRMTPFFIAKQGLN